MSSVHYGIIAGEIAEAKKISQEKLGRIPDILRACLKDVNNFLEPDQQLAFEIVRMDEFLCLTKIPVIALKAGLMLASTFRSKSQKELGIRAELKLSLGIGPVELYKERLRESDGTAFRMADDNLRRMKRNQRLMISTTDQNINDEMIVACGFMDILIHEWSDEQAEAVFLSLTGMNQLEISTELDISQPAVNRRLKAAHLDATEKLLERFTNLVIPS